MQTLEQAKEEAKKLLSADYTDYADKAEQGY